MSFFSDMNLARWIIVLSVLGSIALGVTGYFLHEKRAALEAALNREVPAMARDTQVLARRNTYLLREINQEGLSGQSDPSSYIRVIASDENVLLGNVNIGKPTSSQPVPGIEDKSYSLRPQDKDATFKRLNIANFLFLLEKNSRRMKVTSIRITPEEKSLKPHEISNDLWKWEAEVTSRQKLEPASTP